MSKTRLRGPKSISSYGLLYRALARSVLNVPASYVACRQQLSECPHIAPYEEKLRF